MASHFQREDWQCKTGRKQQIPHQDPDFDLPAFVGLCRGITASVDRAGLIACLADGSNQCSNVRTAGNGRTLRCEIDYGLRHTRDRSQRALDPPDTGRAGHALDREFYRRRNDPVPSVLNRADHIGPDARIGKPDLGALGCEVDTGVQNAADLFQRAFHATDARGAAHAFNRKRECFMDELGLRNHNKNPYESV